MAKEENIFDLRDDSRRNYSYSRGFRWILGISAVGLAVVEGAVLSYQLIHGTFQTSLRSTYGVAWIFLSAGVVFCAWASRMFGPGAIVLTIGNEGAMFRFAGGREYTVRWNDPRFRLILKDYRQNPLAKRLGETGYAHIRNLPSTALTAEALDTLVEEARERRLIVRVQSRGGPWSYLYGSRHERIEIRGNPSLTVPVR